jgi:hypothetical protein
MSVVVICSIFSGHLLAISHETDVIRGADERKSVVNGDESERRENGMSFLSPLCLPFHHAALTACTATTYIDGI